MGEEVHLLSIYMCICPICAKKPYMVVPLTAFTIGPLGFYECVHMPFGLTNATGHISAPEGVMLGRNAPQMVYYLLR